MVNNSTFYTFPDNEENFFFPKTKNTFFQENVYNIKIRNTRIPIYISTNKKEFNMKKLKEDVNSVYKAKRNRLIKQLANLDKDYKKFLEKYDNTNKLLELCDKCNIELTIKVIK